MDIADCLTLDRIVLDLRVRDKLQLLQELARRTAGSGLKPDMVATALQGREELGSTGLGRGFALPHARIEGLDRPFGLFARLARPIDYAAIDDRPVDLAFLLLMPAQDQPGNGSVAALAAVARRFRDADAADRLRSAANAAEAFQVLAG
ncbi:MAG: PTS sugar transporter subunit IIA [Acetobacteraceae bacterium]|nr:PTS sugar transporter subunit IIA [Acetobacteraceae bacterium]